MVNVALDSHTYRYLCINVSSEVTFNEYWINVILLRWDILHSLSNQGMNLPHILHEVDKKWNILLNCSFWGYFTYRWHKWGYQVSADLQRLLVPLFSDEMVGIRLNSNHVLQIHRKKPLSANFEVTFVSLI